MTNPTPDQRARAPRRRVASGPKRPNYMGDADLDKFMMVMTAFMAEFNVLRDRLDTHEQLSRQGIVATPEAIEAFVLSDDDLARRTAMREGFFDRVFRVVFEELEIAERAVEQSDTLPTADVP